MVGFLLLLLSFGALVSAIWGKQAGQAFVSTIAFGAVVTVALLIDAVAFIFWPPFRVFALVAGAIFAAVIFYICYNYVTETHALKRDSQESARKLANEVSQREQTARTLLQQIKQALDHADEHQCGILGGQLQQEGLLAQMFPLVEAAANDADGTKRLSAIRVLQYPSLLQAPKYAILGGLFSKDTHDSIYAQQASGVLCRLAEAHSETLRNRVAAVIALGKITFTDSTPLLLRLVHDQEGDVRAAACNALGHYGADMAVRDRCVQAVLTALHDPYERVKIEAAQALGELTDVRGLKAVQEMSVDAGQTIGVRQAAANAAGKITMAATARI